jgi:hypothetical protein
MHDEEAEGHPNAPELAVVVGVASEGSEVLDAAPRAVAPGELQVDAGAAGRTPLGGVALAGSVGVGDEMVVWDLGQLALSEGQGLTLLFVGALARAPIRRGPEEGRVGRDVGVTRCLPAGWGVAVPVGDRECGYVGGCRGGGFIVIDLCEVCATAGPDGPVEDESGIDCALCYVLVWGWGGGGTRQSIVGMFVAQGEPNGSTERVARRAYHPTFRVNVDDVVRALSAEVAWVGIVSRASRGKGSCWLVAPAVRSH